LSTWRTRFLFMV